MNVNIETNSALRRKLTIQVEPDEIKRELDRAYNEIRRGVVLKGFRPGHAPRNLLERFFGDQVRSDVIQRLVKEYTGKALEENNLTPVVAPEIITEETNLPEALKFSAVFDLKPEVVIKDYEGLKIPPEQVTVSDSDVDKTVEQLRERQATLKKVEGRDTAEEGDLAAVSIEGYEDGKPMSNNKSESRLLEISKNTLAHGIDEVLIGAKAGEETRKSRTYPPEYEHKDLAGKTIEWRALVKEIYSKELPPLDDDFAKDQGECQTVAELRERVREDLTARAHAQADSRARQGLLDMILERNEIEIPESLTAHELSAMQAELASALRGSSVAEEQIAERLKANEEAFRTQAQKRAKSSLVLDALAEQEQVQVSDDELADRMGLVMRQSSGHQREQLTEFYSREENREALRQSMRREKVLDQLLTRAKGGDATVSSAGAP